MVPASPRPPTESSQRPWAAAWRSKQLLIVGIVAEIARGLCISRVALAVASQLGAFASSPVDLQALWNATSDIAAIACALFGATALARIAFTRVIDGLASELRPETAIANARMAVVDIGTLARTVALLASSAEIIGSRGPDSTSRTLAWLNLLTPVMVISVVKSFSTSSADVSSYVSSEERLLARQELEEMRSMTLLNAQDTTCTAYDRAIRPSMKTAALNMLTTIAGSFMWSAWAFTIGSTLGQVIWLCSDGIMHHQSPPTEVFETASASIVLGPVFANLLSLAGTWLLVILGLARVSKNDVDPAASVSSQQSTHSLPISGVLKMLAPDYKLLFVGLIGAVAFGASLTWMVGILMRMLALVMAVRVQCPVSEDHACLAELHSRVHALSSTAVLQCGAAIMTCGFLTFVPFKLVSTKTYARIRSLHFAAACRQGVASFEANQDTTESFGEAHQRLANETNLLFHKPALFAVALSTTISSLIFALVAGNARAGFVVVVVGAICILGDWYRQRKQQSQVQSRSDTYTSDDVANAVTMYRTLLPAMALFYSGHLLEKGAITSVDAIVPSLGAAAFAVIVATLTVPSALSFQQDWQRIVSACAEVIELDKRGLVSSGSRLPSKPNRRIQLQNVTFQDPRCPNGTRLKQLSLTIEAGETVVFCGAKGSGHESILALLARFYEPTIGEVLLDDQTLSSLDPTWLHREIGYVDASPYVFEGSIAANISLGCEVDVTKDKIREAAVLADAHTFIQDYPQGYETHAIRADVRYASATFMPQWTFAQPDQRREMVIQLKSGTKAPHDHHHRIALARVVLRNPSILIVAEPTTDDLSIEGIKAVQRALDTVIKSKKRTTIIIGHALEGVRSADRIYVLENGEIKEKGRHEDLIGIKGGLYRSLVE